MRERVANVVRVVFSLLVIAAAALLAVLLSRTKGEPSGTAILAIGTAAALLLGLTLLASFVKHVAQRESDDVPLCDGCSAPATTRDADDTPLCQDCLDEAAQSTNDAGA